MIYKEKVLADIGKVVDAWDGNTDLMKPITKILSPLFLDKGIVKVQIEESNTCPECGGNREWYGLDFGDMQGFCKDCGKTWK